MDTKLVFCEECRNDVCYTISTVPMVGTIKEKHYNYVGKEAHCVNCGSELFVPELSDFNLRALYDVYRAENGIISLDKIREIPEKYAIGKHPLSLLLGWGEQTFSRYVDGDVPTKQYSDTLLRIYNEPDFYARLLEENKSKLKSARAYKKTLRAVEALLSAPGKNVYGIGTPQDCAVRIPKSLYETLKAHARQEGVSTNEYCLYLLTRNDMAHAST